MRRLILIVSCLLFLVFVPLSAYAATINLELTTDAQNYKITQEDKPLIITLRLGDFINLTEGMTLGYTATIEYDKNIFENVTVIGKNDWNASYSNTSHILEGDVAKATANTGIVELSFKPKKENINQNETTTIRIKDILLTDGEFEITADKEIKINITNEKTKQTRESTKNN